MEESDEVSAQSGQGSDRTASPTSGTGAPSGWLNPNKAENAVSIFVVLGSTAFVAGLLLMANNRLTPLSGSVFRYYLGMFVAGLGGMGITAGFVGIVVMLVLSYQVTTQQTPDSRDS